MQGRSTPISLMGRRLGIALMGGMLIGSVIAPGALATSGLAPVPVTDNVNTDEDVVATGNVLDNDTDADTDHALLTVTGFSPINISRGVIEIAENGDFTYTPAENYIGAGTVTIYDVTDDTGNTRQGYVYISINSLNDVPVAQDHTLAATEDTPLETPVATLLAGATDVETAFGSLTISGVSNPTGGTVDLADGIATFTPDLNLCGVAEGGYDFDVSDGTDAGTGYATVDIACENDPPIPSDLTLTIAQGSDAVLQDVLADATDPEDDDITLTDVSVAEAAGAVEIAGGEIQYTPALLFHGDAVITYTVSDGDLTAEATLTVTVTQDAVAPSPTAPVVHFGSGRVDATAPLLISWGATDAVSGVKSYVVEVSVNGGAFTLVYAGTATSITRYYAFNNALHFRVKAIDNENNTSGYATAGARRIVAYQAPASTGIAYTTGWTTAYSTAASGNSFRYTTLLGKYAQLTFSGREALYVAPKSSISGNVKVYVDGSFKGTYSLYRATSLHGQTIYKATWGAYGSHTFKIMNASSGRRANLDAIIVLK